MKKRLRQMAVWILLLVLAIGLAVLTVLLIAKGGNYPAGTSTYDVIYRARRLLTFWQEGVIYPLYDSLWYNGTSLLRYVEPLPVYLMATCMALAGSVNAGYLLFVGILLFAGTLSWMCVGAKIGRLKTGWLVGILWFFMPANLHTLFLTGNIGRCVAFIILPIFAGNIYLYFCTQARRGRVLVGIIISEALVALCSVTLAIEAAAVAVLFGVIVSITKRTWRKLAAVIFANLLGVLFIGFWLYPAWSSGIRVDGAATMSYYFQDALASLNPFYRLQGNDQREYFGLAALVVALFGLLAGNRKSRAGYLACIVLFLGTTSSAYVIFSHFPLKRYLWMTEYIPLALCLLLLSFLYWDTLKRVFYILCVFLLALDIYPSIQVNQGEGYYTAEEQTEIFVDTTLLSEARSLTKQRMVFLDGDLYGASGQYLAALAEDGTGEVAQSGGNGWRYAATAENVVDYNDALERRHYIYLFDRLLMLGNDTILLDTDASEYLSEDIDDVIAAAEYKGYELVDHKGKFYLFHQDTSASFGVVHTYDGLGIGTSAKLISYTYDNMISGSSTNLNDYTYEELMQYQLVYLAGFTYDDKDAAEKLIRRISEDGVRVVIDGTTMPTDEHTGISEFLGVYAQTIEFENGYPILYYNDEEVVCKLFPQDESEWKTSCLSGLTNMTGYLYDNGLKMGFAGTGENENIHYIGLGLMYHYYLTQDAEGSEIIIRDVMGDALDTPVTCEVVPLSVEAGATSLTIRATEDNVNTTIAYTDEMQISGSYHVTNHLIHMDQGTITITFTAVGWKEGLLISICSLLAAVLFVLAVDRKSEGYYEKRREEKRR